MLGVLGMVGLLAMGGCDRREVTAPAGWPGPGQEWSGESVVLRVLLAQQRQVRVGGDGGVSITTAGGELVAGPLTGTGCWAGRVEERWVLHDDAGGVLAQESQAGEWGSTLNVRSAGGGFLRVGEGAGRPYRGELRLVAGREGRVALVNDVGVEEYLLGVVGSEMPAYWHRAALQSQAVAARTYALYRKHRGVGRGAWDLGSDQGSQVYGGVERETARVREAVETTAGLVLTYPWQGQERIFPTFYSSTCGGHTRDAAEVFSLSLAPLKGVRCPYCRGVAKAEMYRWGPVEFDKAEVSKRLLAADPDLKVLGSVADMRVALRSEEGRVERLELVGANGLRRTIRGETFRMAVNTPEQPVRSSWFELVDGGDVWRLVNGHGWGHGVGLCQCGAEGLARAGEDCVGILSHYYPGARLVRAY